MHLAMFIESSLQDSDSTAQLSGPRVLRIKYPTKTSPSATFGSSVPVSAIPSMSSSPATNASSIVDSAEISLPPLLPSTSKRPLSSSSMLPPLIPSSAQGSTFFSPQSTVPSSLRPESSTASARPGSSAPAASVYDRSRIFVSQLVYRGCQLQVNSFLLFCQLLWTFNVFQLQLHAQRRADEVFVILLYFTFHYVKKKNYFSFIKYLLSKRTKATQPLEMLATLEERVSFVFIRSSKILFNFFYFWKFWVH